MNQDEQTVKKLYELFNKRDIDGIFALLSEDIDWANGMDSTQIHGKQAVREYWTYQWSVIDPYVEPVKFVQDADNSIMVDVHQVVKNPEGEILVDETVQHAFHFENGLVKQFDIKSDSQLAKIHPTININAETREV